MEENDVFIVDRRIRDSMAYLEELGIKAVMLSLKTQGENLIEHTMPVQVYVCL